MGYGMKMMRSVHVFFYLLFCRIMLKGLKGESAIKLFAIVNLIFFLRDVE